MTEDTMNVAARNIAPATPVADNPLGRGASAAIAGAVDRIQDDLSGRVRELNKTWDGIKAEGDKLLDDFARESSELVEEYMRRSHVLQERTEAFTAETRAAQQAVHAAAEAGKRAA